MNKHLYLTGFMGSGKTAVGVILSRRLNIPFIDTDALIEKKIGCSINDIFSQKGEVYFRECEREIIRDLPSYPSVVSVGGGAILSFANREIFKKGVWVNLQASASVIFKRIVGTKHRPLLSGVITQDEIENRLRSRRPYYDLAKYQVNTDGLSPQAVVDVILRLVH